MIGQFFFFKDAGLLAPEEATLLEDGSNTFSGTLKNAWYSDSA